jgi:UDP-N-acetylmuramoyl-L-alanyl-D-glutamate--2,6-diaminopimelate ligase
MAHCPPIPGRSEAVDVGQPFLVVVDYAHTPDALAAQIATARGLARPGGRVCVVVGCRGGRDRYKRPETGRVAATADVAVLTSDSPAEEDPGEIVSQMLAGTLGRRDARIIVELDRAAAIRQAIGLARPGDVVLICGRGHETRQRLAGRVVQLDDREQARAALADLGWADPFPSSPLLLRESRS